MASDLLVVNYPFLSFSRNFLSEPSVTSADELEGIATKLVARVEAKSFLLPSASPEKAVKEYALARLLLNYLNNQDFARKYARVFSRFVEQNLENADETELMAVAKDFFSTIERENEEYVVSAFECLKYSNAPLNTGVLGGKIFLTKESLAGVLAQAVEKKFLDFSALSVQKIPQELRKSIESLASLFPESEEKPVYDVPKGFFTNLPCISFIRAGISEGRRYYGAMALCIACVKDGLPLAQAQHVLREYSASCKSGANPFTEREALATLSWVYAHSTIGFSCNTIRSHGFAGAGNSFCANCLYNERNRRLLKKGELNKPSALKKE